MTGAPKVLHPAVGHFSGYMRRFTMSQHELHLACATAGAGPFATGQGQEGSRGWGAAGRPGFACSLPASEENNPVASSGQMPVGLG